MKSPHPTGLFPLFCLLGAPLLAQPQIGGGSCNSSLLNGTYAVTMSGRQVTASGNFAGVFQANGSATFDGLNKVTLKLTVDSNQSVSTPLTWSGTYSIQTNCAGQVTINTGGSAVLGLVLYNGGTDFLLAGNDATNSYSGSGNTQPANCAANTFSGVYTYNATGFTLAGSAVNGVEDAAGLLQFDGQGNVTVNITTSTSAAAATPLTMAGTYSVASNCLGSATLTDSKSNSYIMSFSVYGATRFASTGIYVSLAQNSKFLMIGTAHAIYGQPTASLTGVEVSVWGGAE